MYILCYNIFTKLFYLGEQKMKTEREKMLAGELHISSTDEELFELRKQVRTLFHEFNSTYDQGLLDKIFQTKLDGVFIEPPFYCDYGSNIELGKKVYMNFGCTILDCAKVKIGDHTMLGPHVQIYAAAHPLDAKTRVSGLEYALPITIGKNCWIGGNSIVLPGITIGNNCVIGAGSVVTKNIPDNSIAVGNPCRVIKETK